MTRNLEPTDFRGPLLKRFTVGGARCEICGAVVSDTYEWYCTGVHFCQHCTRYAPGCGLEPFVWLAQGRSHPLHCSKSTRLGGPCTCGLDAAAEILETIASKKDTGRTV